MLNQHDKRTLHLIAFHSLDFSEGSDTLAIVEEELESILIGLDYSPRNARGIQPLDSIYHMTIEQSDNALFIRTYVNAHGWRKFRETTIENVESSVESLISYEQARALFYDHYRAQHDTERELFDLYHFYGARGIELNQDVAELYWEMGCIFMRLSDLYHAAYSNLEFTQGTRTTYARSNILLG